jgi:hypothetical protein
MPEPIPRNRNVSRMQHQFQNIRKSRLRYPYHIKVQYPLYYIIWFLLRTRVLSSLLRTYTTIKYQLRTQFLPPILQLCRIVSHKRKLWIWLAGSNSFTSIFSKVLFLFIGVGVLVWLAPFLLAVLAFVEQIFGFIFITLFDIVHVAWLIISSIFSHAYAILELISAHPFVTIALIVMGIVIGLIARIKRG